MRGRVVSSRARRMARTIRRSSADEGRRRRRRRLRTSASTPASWRRSASASRARSALGARELVRGRSRRGAAARGARAGAEPRAAGCDAREPAGAEKYARVLRLIHAYRARGHRIADTDPLGARDDYFPELDPAHYGLGHDDLDTPFLAGDLPGGPIQPLAPDPRDAARDVLPQGRRRVHAHPGSRAASQWLQRRLEETREHDARSTHEERAAHPREALRRGALRALPPHASFVGQKRFGLEGAEALIPLLDTIVEDAPSQGVREFVIGMAHRGRLNVLVEHRRQVATRSIFSEFEDIEDIEAPFGSGDVKYHKGYSSDRRTRAGARRAPLAHRQPVAPRGGEPGRRRPRAREAGARRRPARPQRRAAADPRRRRVRRARAWSPRR